MIEIRMSSELARSIGRMLTGTADIVDRDNVDVPINEAMEPFVGTNPVTRETELIKIIVVHGYE